MNKNYIRFRFCIIEADGLTTKQLHEKVETLNLRKKYHEILELSENGRYTIDITNDIPTKGSRL